MEREGGRGYFRVDDGGLAAGLSRGSEGNGVVPRLCVCVLLLLLLLLLEANELQNEKESGMAEAFIVETR